MGPDVNSHVKSDAEIASKHDVATWSVDLSTRQVTRSENHDAMFGYAVNLPHWNIEHFLAHVHPADASMFTATFRNAVELNENFDFAFRVKWPDGSEHRLRTAGSITFSEEGKPQAVFGSTQFAS